MIDSKTLALHQQNYKPISLGSTTAEAPAKKGPGGLKGFIARNLNTIGQVGGGVGGGAAGGALAGSAVLPGIGTGLGALIGGTIGAFTGGAGGEAAKRKALGENQNLGESLKQGGIGAGLELATAGTAPILGKLLGRGGEVAAGKGALKGSEELLASTRGIAPATKVGSKTLSTAESAAGQQYLSNISKSNLPKKVLSDLESHLNETGGKIGDLITEHNRPLSKAEAKVLDPHLKVALEHMPSNAKVAGKDLSELQALKENLQKQISFNRTSGAAIPKTQEEMKIARDELSKFLHSNVDGLEGLSKDYAQGSKIKPFVEAAKRNPKGLTLPVKGGFLGKIGVGGERTAGAIAGAAKAASGTSGALAGILGATKPVAGRLALKGLGSSLGSSQPNDQTQPGSLGDTGTGGSLEALLNTPDTTNTDTASTDSGNLFTAQSIQPQIVKALANGDLKSASALESLYKTFGQPAKQSAAQEAATSNIGLASSALKSISQAYDTSGGGKGAPGLASHIPVVGQYLGGERGQKAVAYNQTKIETATQLAKALTGSTRPAATVIEYYLHSLPGIEDRPAVAAQKLKFLQNDLKNRASSVAETGDTSNLLDVGNLVGTQ